MKTLYLECHMGAAGDMLMAALLELHPDPDSVLARLNALGLPGVAFAARPCVRCGITGTRISVTVHGREEDEHEEPFDGRGHGHHAPSHPHDHHHLSPHAPREHHHTGLGDIASLLAGLDVPAVVRQDAMAVYTLIAEAEGLVHGRPVDQVHFHEVGALDAVADVVGVCLLMAELAPDRVLASPVHVGSGHVSCAHGVLPVPAPATAHILQGVPVYGGEVPGELCTPTGAALLRHFVQDFGPLPVMRVERTGYGMGSREFDRANCVRAMLGETDDREESALELACNLDDMTPEAVGFAFSALLEAGALDVWVTPVQMKKGRPGVVLSCLCREAQRDGMVELLFRHTSTLGVRERAWTRHVLDRTEEERETPFGPVRVKRAEGYGVKRAKAEYEDVARLAREKGMSFDAMTALVASDVVRKDA